MQTILLSDDYNFLNCKWNVYVVVRCAQQFDLVQYQSFSICTEILGETWYRKWKGTGMAQKMYGNKSFSHFFCSTFSCVVHPLPLFTIFSIACQTKHVDSDAQQNKRKVNYTSTSLVGLFVYSWVGGCLVGSDYKCWHIRESIFLPIPLSYASHFQLFERCFDSLWVSGNKVHPKLLVEFQLASIFWAIKHSCRTNLTGKWILGKLSHCHYPF